MSDRIAVFNDGTDPAARPARGPLRAPGERLRRPVHRREQQAARHGRGDRGRRRHASRLEDGAACQRAGGQLRRARRAHPALDPARAGGGRRRRRRENRTEAQVLELIYHGDHIRCRLRGARQRRLHRQGPEQPRQRRRCRSASRHDGRLGDRGLPGARRRLKTTARPGPGQGRPSDNRLDPQGDPNEPQTASRRHRRRDPADRGAGAQDLPPCENCADGMTVVSWGGAYQVSQQKAYAEPYAAIDRHQLHLGRELERGGGEAPRPERGRQRHLGPRRRRGPGQPAALRRGPGGGDRRRRGARARRRRLDRRPTTSATAWSTSATSRRSSSRRPSATAPTSPSGTARCPRTSAPSSTSRTSPASAASRSGRRRTSSGR